MTNTYAPAAPNNKENTITPPRIARPHVRWGSLAWEIDCPRSLRSISHESGTAWLAARASDPGLDGGRAHDHHQADQQEHQSERHDPIGQAEPVLDHLSDLENDPGGTEIDDENPKQAGVSDSVPHRDTSKWGDALEGLDEDRRDPR